jgi:hypothetical protein
MSIISICFKIYKDDIISEGIKNKNLGRSVLHSIDTEIASMAKVMQKQLDKVNSSINRMKNIKRKGAKNKRTKK